MSEKLEDRKEDFRLMSDMAVLELRFGRPEIAEMFLYFVGNIAFEVSRIENKTS